MGAQRAGHIGFGGRDGRSSGCGGGRDGRSSGLDFEFLGQRQLGFWSTFLGQRQLALARLRS